MSDVRAMYPPTGKRKHQFCSVERSGKEMWVDLTILRKSRSIDSVPVFRLENGTLIYDHFESCSHLHQKGLY